MSLLARRRRKKRIAALSGIEIPTFPASTLRALQELRSNRRSLAEVGAAVAQDPQSSIRVLGLVNSAASGLRRKIENVAHAASLLGRDKLESVLLAAAVSRALPGKGNRHFDPRRFWNAAARRAVLAREVASVTNPADAMSSYTAALLGDLAIPLLVEAQGDAYGEALRAWRAGEGELAGIERDQFGWDHAQVGAELAESWSLPDRLTAAIGGHHRAGPSADFPAVNLVSLLREPDDSGAEDNEELFERARAEFDIEPDDCAELVERANREAPSLADSLV